MFSSDAISVAPQREVGTDPWAPKGAREHRNDRMRACDLAVTALPRSLDFSERTGLRNIPPRALTRGC